MAHNHVLLLRRNRRGKRSFLVAPTFPSPEHDNHHKNGWGLFLMRTGQGVLYAVGRAALFNYLGLIARPAGKVFDEARCLVRTRSRERTRKSERKRRNIRDFTRDSDCLRNVSVVKCRDKIGAYTKLYDGFGCPRVLLRCAPPRLPMVVSSKRGTAKSLKASRTRLRKQGTQSV